MVRTFRLSSQLVRRIGDLGIPLATVWHKTELPGSWEDGHRPLLTTDQLFALWDAIGDTSGDATIGLGLGAESRIERYDAVALAAVYARTVGEAIARIGRYKRLTCPEDLTVVREGDTYFSSWAARGNVPSWPRSRPCYPSASQMLWSRKCIPRPLADVASRPRYERPGERVLSL